MKDITKNYDIIQYNAENLKKALKNKFISLEDIESKKRHFTYLLEYLGNSSNGSSLNAGMILLEKKYTSRSYLEDYQEHYFSSYNNYKKHCKRIHFFEHKVEESICSDKKKKNEFFKTLLQDTPKSENIWNGYLGYIVIRPIPTGIIGATLLKTYPKFSSDKTYERKYTVRKNYKINVLGKERVIKSLIYVEQDRIVGACATSALYVAFHRLSHLFGTTRPNQKKISNAAGISFISPNRKLMNKDGLSTFQICKVIEHFGLEPEIYQLKEFSANEIKSILYSYLKMGLPVILGFKFDKVEKLYHHKIEEEDHAITLTGYSEIIDQNIPFKSYRGNKITDNKTVKKILKKEFPIILKSNNINQFYAHDDQIGPFSRIGILNKPNKIVTSWWDKKKGIDKKLLATPFVSIIPVSERIRIPWETIIENVKIINIWLHTILYKLDEIAWDVYLSRSNKEKKNILESDGFNYTLHGEALADNLPKYVWVADCHLPGSKLFKVVFDASDINHKFLAWDVIYYNESFKSVLEIYFNEALNQNSINNKEKYILDVIETTGIEITNLFRKSLKLDKLFI